MKCFVALLVLFAIDINHGALAEETASARTAQEIFNETLALVRKGDTQAQYHVGLTYEICQLSKCDNRQAFEWLKKSADAGNPLAVREVGGFYGPSLGRRKAIDPVKELEYLLIAAKGGDATCQDLVAGIYANRNNMEEAIKWWKEAASYGKRTAIESLSDVYGKGLGVPKDLTLSYAYLRLAAKLGMPIDSSQKLNFDSMAAKLSKAEVESAEAFVSAWKPKPMDPELQRLKVESDKYVRSIREIIVPPGAAPVKL